MPPLRISTRLTLVSRQADGLNVQIEMGVLREFGVRHKTAISLLVMLVITALGLMAVHALSQEINVADLRQQLRTIAPSHVMLAILFTAGSFTCLTIYDFLALRTVGAGQPYATAAKGGALSYAVGNMLGLSLLTGGSVRMRIYGQAGVSPENVARVIAIAALTFWSGIFSLFGIVLLLRPGALSLGGFAVPEPLQLAMGGAILLCLMAALVASARGKRLLTLHRFSLPLPSPGTGLAQLSIAAIDIACSAAVLFVLLPRLGLESYPTLLTAYVIALVIAVLTHAPGGLGVFETIILLALPQIDTSDMLTGLIAYRLIYYVLPFLLAMGVLAASEGAQIRRRFGTVARGSRTVATSIAPFAMGSLVFVAGAILLLSGTLPALPDRLKAVESVLPLLLVNFSHLVASLIGTLLLMVGFGLFRRLDAARHAASGLLLAGAAFALLRGIDYEEAATLLAVFALLRWTGPAFYRRTAFSAEPLSLRWILAVVAVILLSGWLGLFAYRNGAYGAENWWELGVRGDAPRFLRGLILSVLVALGFALWRLASPHHIRLSAGTLPDEVWDKAIAATDNAEAHLARTWDKRFIVSQDGSAFIMYQVQGRSWIAMGDPVGPAERWSGLMWQLREVADREQGRAVFYQLSAAALPHVIDLGLGIMKLGEEARVDLTSFTLSGAARKSLRNTYGRMEREGQRFEVIEGDALLAEMDALRAVSDSWLSAKKQREKRFSLGRFDPAYIGGAPVAVVRNDAGGITAFANLWTLPGREELSIDLMRHAPDARSGSMDYLFVNIFLWGQSQGYRWFNLGMAPLSDIENRRLAPLWARAAGLLYHHGEVLYGYEGLRAYKEKFHPIWRSRYLAAPRGLPMAQALIDTTLVSGKP